MLTLVATAAQPGESYPAVTEDGAWCWFSDPRAVHVSEPSNTLVTGWVTKDGSVEFGHLDVATGAVDSHIAYPKLQYDDHDNPAFVPIRNGNILAFYTKHGDGKLYQHASGGLKFADNWGAVRALDPNLASEVARLGRGGYTYANPFQLRQENNRVYCFGRWAGFKPNMIWSDNGGASWSPSQVMIVPRPINPKDRPYVKYHSDGISRVHLVFTDGHPRVEPQNSVYYAYYEGGAFHRADGSTICTVDELPFEPRNATVVYDATQTDVRAWVWDVAVDAAGRVVVAYTRLPAETDHRYHYAVYDDGRWLDHEVCRAGRWFPQTPAGTEEREVHYSGGMTLDPNQPGTVYVSRPMNGRFEIECWVTGDLGASWKHRAITTNSATDQVRPHVARYRPSGDPAVVLWMQNRRYVHYTDYNCAIRYLVDR
jgi:hypothetical protein